MLLRFVGRILKIKLFQAINCVHLADDSRQTFLLSELPPSIATDIQEARKFLEECHQLVDKMLNLLLGQKRMDFQTRFQKCVSTKRLTDLRRSPVL